MFHPTYPDPLRHSASELQAGAHGSGTFAVPQLSSQLCRFRSVSDLARSWVRSIKDPNASSIRLAGLDPCRWLCCASPPATATVDAKVLRPFSLFAKAPGLPSAAVVARGQRMPDMHPRCAASRVLPALGSITSAGVRYLAVIVSISSAYRSTGEEMSATGCGEVSSARGSDR